MLPSFLAAAAANTDPPRVALTVGSGTAARVDATFLNVVPLLRFVFNTGTGMDPWRGGCGRSARPRARPWRTTVRSGSNHSTLRFELL